MQSILEKKNCALGVGAQFGAMRVVTHRRRSKLVKKEWLPILFVYLVGNITNKSQNRQAM